MPVVNALTDSAHPCQALADLQTIREQQGRPAGLTLTYVGDGNNMAHSLLLAGALAGMHVRVASPAGYRADRAGRAPGAARSLRRTGGSASVTNDPLEAADRRRRPLHRRLGVDGPGGRGRQPARWSSSPYALDERARRSGAPTTSSSCTACRRIAARRSPPTSSTGRTVVVFDQAENRLHAQKALLAFLLEQA